MKTKIIKTFGANDQTARCDTHDPITGCPKVWTGRNALAVAARHTQHHGHPTEVDYAAQVSITRDPEQVA